MTTMHDRLLAAVQKAKSEELDTIAYLLEGKPHREVARTLLGLVGAQDRIYFCQRLEREAGLRPAPARIRLANGSTITATGVPGRDPLRGMPDDEVPF